VGDLGPGESITVKGRSGTEYLDVVDGEVDVAVGDGAAVRFRPTDDESKPITIERGGSAATISAVGNALLARVESDVLDYLVSWDTVGRDVGTETGDIPQRVAAVRMLEDGVVLHMGKEDFDERIGAHMIERVAAPGDGVALWSPASRTGVRARRRAA
jgi:hypothetical protein